MAYKSRECPQCLASYHPGNKGQVHCSRACWLAASGFAASRPCLICGEVVKWTGTRRKYCSRACYAKAARLDGSPRFRGGTVMTNGYRVRMVNGKKILVHRQIMAEHLGRPLESSEIVHHIDGNRLNNELTNLQLLHSDKEHRTCHAHYHRSESEKECARCRQIKPRTEFYPRHARGRDPSRAECKACCAAIYAAKKAKAS